MNRKYIVFFSVIAVVIVVALVVALFLRVPILGPGSTVSIKEASLTWEYSVLDNCYRGKQVRVVLQNNGGVQLFNLYIQATGNWPVDYESEKGFHLAVGAGLNPGETRTITDDGTNNLYIYGAKVKQSGTYSATFQVVKYKYDDSLTGNVENVYGELTINTLTNNTQINVGTRTIAWERTWGLDHDDTALSVIRTNDGGYAVAGYSHTYYEDYWLVKTDASGNKQWDRTYGGTWDDDAYCVVQTSDGGYVLAGISVSYSADQGGGATPPYGSFWLVKTDGNGNATWSNGYGGKNSGTAYSVIQTGDGGYVMAGDGFANLVKTNENGVLQWSKSYGGTARCVVQTSDGGYALAGSTKGSGSDPGNFWLVKTDANGNTQWIKTFGGVNNDCAFSVVQTSDGGYTIAGYTGSYGAGSTDVYLVKTDSAGNMQWNKTYGGTGTDEAYSLIKTSDGGYAIAGKATISKVLMPL